VVEARPGSSKRFRDDVNAQVRLLVGVLRRR
jgi:hypothetical protein